MAQIAYLGPPGTFTSEALEQCGDLSEALECASVTEVVEGVEEGRYEAGIVPIESSVEGVVTAHLDRIVFHTESVQIHSEHVVDITFDALVSPDAAADARLSEVVSHPVALGQCGEWIRQIGGQGQPAPSTAAGCEQARARPGVIALASPRAGQQYGLSVLAHDVGDHPGAQTRFWRIGRGESGARMRSPKTTLVCLPETDRTGVLAEMLNILALRDIALTGLAVRPTKDQLGRYCFILTLEGHIRSAGLRAAVGELLDQGCAVKLLGSYEGAAKALRAAGAASVVPGACHGEATGALGAALASEELWRAGTDSTSSTAGSSTSASSAGGGHPGPVLPGGIALPSGMPWPLGLVWMPGMRGLGEER